MATKTLLPNTLDFTGWSNLLGEKESKKIANNTWAERVWIDSERGYGVGIRLHGTYIATYTVDGALILNTGGWRTPTTLRRLRAVVPASVSIRVHRGEWTVHAPKADFPFEDGCTVRIEDVALWG